jgi:hypothetical protein
MIRVDGYHPGGMDPDACAEATMGFFKRLAAKKAH